MLETEAEAEANILASMTIWLRMLDPDIAMVFLLMYVAIGGGEFTPSGIFTLLPRNRSDCDKGCCDFSRQLLFIAK